MLTSNIKATIDIQFPVKEPDGHGNIYTRQAVREAARNIGEVPLRCGNIIIGTVDAAYISSEQEHKAVLRIYATIPVAGTCESGRRDEDGNVCQFNIDAIQLHPLCG